MMQIFLCYIFFATLFLLAFGRAAAIGDKILLEENARNRDEA